MAIHFKPLADNLGVEVSGVSMAEPISSVDVEALRSALREHLVMVVRDQKLSPGAYVTAMRSFGEPMRQHMTKLLHHDHPEIVVLDSRTANSRDDDGTVMPSGSRAWHTDHTNHPRPPKMTTLYAVKLPSSGGDTGFANMHLAYERLDADEKAQLEALRTINVIEQNSDYVDSGTRAAFTASPQTHPFIRTHPETKRKAIYVHPGKLAKFEGWDAAESKAFVADLLQRVLTPDVMYRHIWRPGDLVLWDNRSLMHLAYRNYDPAEGRILHRMCLQGDVPV